MRIPLAVSLESRDGTLTKDAKCQNAIVERKGETTSFVRKRPGNVDLGLIKAGVAQLLTYWNGGIRTVQDDYFNGATSGTHAVWNSADKGNDVTLSGGDLTVAISGSGSDGVRSTISKTTGKWYWEITDGNGGQNLCGVANATQTLELSSGQSASALGQVAHSLIVDGDGTIYKGGANLGSIGTRTSGDVVGIALDMDAGTVMFRKNGGAFTTISGANVPTGALFAACGQYAGSTDSMTANFGESAFAYSVPIGYNSGFYAEGSLDVGSSTALSPSEADLMFSAQDNGSNAPTPYLMIKNAAQAWTINRSGTVAQITDVDYPGTYSVTLSSLTRSGTTATATTPTDTNFQVGATVTIAGANESAYNGAKTVLSVTPSITVSTEPVNVRITRAGTTATATVQSTPHGFTTGQSVTIAGADQAEYNGTYTVTVTSPLAFTFTVAVVGTDVASPATGSPVMRVGIGATSITNHGGATYEDFTASFVDAHGYSNGDTPTLDGSLWGLVVITVANATTFSFTFTISGVTNAQFAFGTFYRATPPVISSITRVGTVATVTTSAPHTLTNRWVATISGATQPQYNLRIFPRITGASTFEYDMESFSSATPVTPATGTITATQNSVTAATFTYSVSGSPTTPATGTITATGGRNTVPGIVYLNGRFYVMDIFGVIYASDEDAPAAWSALAYLTADNETGVGRAIAKALSYVTAFKEWSTEFFYDAGNEPPGTPLSPVDNGFTQVGCASGDSVADVAGSLCWIAQEKKVKGRSVYVMAGTQQQKVSTEDVSRILTADDLSVVHAFGLTLDGHRIYLLTLVDSDITLAYDLDSQSWTQWTSLTAQTPQSISSITRSGTTCTVTFGSAHSLVDGDPLLIAGASQSDYNGLKQVSYVSTTVVTFEDADSPVTPATGTITGTRYVPSYFKFTKYANCNGQDLVLHESDGHIYEILPSLYRDAGQPIDVLIRTTRLDGGSKARKKNGRITVVGDVVSDFVMVRTSDDDMNTKGSFRRVDMSKEEPNIRRCGSFKARNFEVRHIGDNPLRLEALELEIE